MISDIYLCGQLLGSVCDGPGKDIDDYHAGDNQAHADDCRQVRDFPVQQGPGGGDQHDADAGPDGVGDAQRDAAQGQGHEIEGRAISQHDDYAGNDLGEFPGCLEGAGGDYFSQDGDCQIDVGHLFLLLGSFHHLVCDLNSRPAIAIAVI